MYDGEYLLVILVGRRGSMAGIFLVATVEVMAGSGKVLKGGNRRTGNTCRHREPRSEACICTCRSVAAAGRQMDFVACMCCNRYYLAIH